MMEWIVLLKLHLRSALYIMHEYYHHRNFSTPIGKSTKAIFINVGIPQHNFG